MNNKYNTGDIIRYTPVKQPDSNNIISYFGAVINVKVYSQDLFEYEIVYFPESKPSKRAFVSEEGLAIDTQYYRDKKIKEIIEEK